MTCKSSEANYEKRNKEKAKQSIVSSLDKRQLQKYGFFLINTVKGKPLTY